MWGYSSFIFSFSLQQNFQGKYNLTSLYIVFKCHRGFMKCNNEKDLIYILRLANAFLKR